MIRPPPSPTLFPSPPLSRPRLPAASPVRRRVSPPPHFSVVASHRRRVSPPPHYSVVASHRRRVSPPPRPPTAAAERRGGGVRSEEHTSELQSHLNLVCRLLL